MEKNRKGFSLIELLVALMIFSFMIASLTTLYSTANKHMFQNYRQNKLKNQLIMAIKTMNSCFASATDIEFPLKGNNANSVLIASNIDPTGCYPIEPSQPMRWDYFCLRNDGKLFYHSAAVVGGGTCPSGPTWGSPLAGLNCGNAGGTIVLLADGLSVPANAPAAFSRATTEVNTVRVALRVFWTPPASMASIYRQVDYSLETYLSANIPGN